MFQTEPNQAVLPLRAAMEAGDAAAVTDAFAPDGKIRELTAFFRPLPAAALALRLIAAGLVRRKSPARAMVVSSLTRPLAALTRAGDPVGARLVRSAL